MSFLDVLGDIAGAIPIVGGIVNGVVDIFDELGGGGGSGSASTTYQLPAAQPPKVELSGFAAIPSWVWLLLTGAGLFLLFRRSGK